MQSNQARIAVGAAALIAVVALFIVFSGGDDGGDETTTAAEVTTTTGSGEPADGSGSEPEEPPKPPKPEFETIVIDGGQPAGGVADLSYKKGDEIRLEVFSDVDEHVHVHGYDLFEDVAAGGRARFRFPADIDGVFEIELEDSGVQIAQLTVKP